MSGTASSPGAMQMALQGVLRVSFMPFIKAFSKLRPADEWRFG